MEIIDKLELIFNYIVSLDLDSYIVCVIFGIFITNMWYKNTDNRK